MKYPKNRKPPTYTGTVPCKRCGVAAPKRSAVQKYCLPCSEAADLERKKLHHIKRGKARLKEERSKLHGIGAELNSPHILDLETSKPLMPEMAWYSRVSVDFSWSGSKNHIFANTARGHVFMRAESSAFRAEITAALREATRDVTVRQNKLWLDMFVQKPSHRGDAANFVDLVCDAAKDAIGLDDRWFSLRSVDWQIVKTDPKLFIGVGQEAGEDVRVCSSCGRLLTPDNFQRARNLPLGVGRNCRDCLSAGKKRSKRSIQQQAEMAAELGIGVFG